MYVCVCEKSLVDSCYIFSTMFLCIFSLKKKKVSVQTKRRDLWLPKGRQKRGGRPEGCTESLGFADVNYSVQNGQTTRCYCITEN